MTAQQLCPADGLKAVLPFVSARWLLGGLLSSSSSLKEGARERRSIRRWQRGKTSRKVMENKQINSIYPCNIFSNVVLYKESSIPCRGRSSSCHGCSNPALQTQAKEVRCDWGLFSSCVAWHQPEPYIPASLTSNLSGAQGIPKRYFWN